jgi:hypothetical protein
MAVCGVIAVFVFIVDQIVQRVLQVVM